MIDTHCHLTHEQLQTRTADVIERANRAGVDRMISVATSIADAQQAIEVARRHPQVWATAGVHPSEAAYYAKDDSLINELRVLLAQPRVAAMGEIGLDLHYPTPSLNDQLELLERQLTLACELEVPIVVHNREATEQMLSALERTGVSPTQCVFHCFSGKEAELDAILDSGAMVSYTGLITFANAKEVARCASGTPLSRVMIETDAPFLTPEPHRKTRPNEPGYLPHTAEFLAQLHGLDVQDLVQTLDQNAERFFNLSE